MSVVHISIFNLFSLILTFIRPLSFLQLGIFSCFSIDHEQILPLPLWGGFLIPLHQQQGKSRRCTRNWSLHPPSITQIIKLDLFKFYREKSMHHIFRRPEIYQDYAMSSQLSSLLLMIGISQIANPNGLSENNVKELYGLNYAKSKHPKRAIFNLLAYKTQKNQSPSFRPKK